MAIAIADVQIPWSKNVSVCALRTVKPVLKIHACKVRVSMDSKFLIQNENLLLNGKVLKANHSKSFLINICRLKVTDSPSPETMICFLKSPGSQKTVAEEGAVSLCLLSPGCDQAASLLAPRHDSRQVWCGPRATCSHEFSFHLKPWPQTKLDKSDRL